MLSLPVCAVFLAVGLIGPVEPAQAACTVTAPANITQSNDPNQAGAVVTYPAPTTSGTCGTITCSPASGSLFPLGVTMTTCQSSTEAGSRASFLIKVNDTQAPTITAPSNQTANNDPGQASAAVAFPPPVATDNAPGVTKSCDRPSGSIFPLGATSVNCTARDTSGNTSTATFSVTVKDVEAPLIFVPGTVKATAPTGGSGTAVTYPAPQAIDNSGQVVSVACSPPSGSMFSIGTTAVNCSAKDAAGNKSGRSFNVEVQLPVVQIVERSSGQTKPKETCRKGYKKVKVKSKNGKMKTVCRKRKRKKR